METDLLMPGPKTKAARLLGERALRKAERTLRQMETARKVRELEAARRPAKPAFKPRAAPTPLLSSISAVSEQLGLSHRTIRFYEEQGLISCTRGPKNTRMLDETAKAALRLIVRLKAMGLSLTEISDFLTDETSNLGLLRERLAARLGMLDEQRAAIAGWLNEF